MPDIMNKKKRLPVGVDLFETLIRQEYYYLDKTLFIRQLINQRGFVNLFTRPRRFGKTLNMSMLKSFFEIGADSSLFDGLAVSQERELCERYQGQYPVVFLPLKSMEGEDYKAAIKELSILVANECRRLSYLAHSSKVESNDLEDFLSLKNGCTEESILQYSLVTLMRMLRDHYGKQVILLIDEYDVPLDKANDHGYYGQMVTFLRGFLGEAFKTNPHLFFVAVTGCLRISKEGIFTGINNLKIDTISDIRYDECFGFTDADVAKILEDYDLSYAHDGLKEWYDGYLLEIGRFTAPGMLLTIVTGFLTCLTRNRVLTG